MKIFVKTFFQKRNKIQIKTKDKDEDEDEMCALC